MFNIASVNQFTSSYIEDLKLETFHKIHNPKSEIRHPQSAIRNYSTLISFCI